MDIDRRITDRRRADRRKGDVVEQLNTLRGQRDALIRLSRQVKGKDLDQPYEYFMGRIREIGFRISKLKKGGK